MKFTEFYGTAHLAGKNVASYKLDNGRVRLQAEDTISGKVFDHIDFASVEDADDWFGDFSDTNVKRLAHALVALDAL